MKKASQFPTTQGDLIKLCVLSDQLCKPLRIFRLLSLWLLLRWLLFYQNSSGLEHKQISKEQSALYLLWHNWVEDKAHMFSFGSSAATSLGLLSLSFKCWCFQAAEAYRSTRAPLSDLILSSNIFPQRKCRCYFPLGLSKQSLTK